MGLGLLVRSWNLSVRHGHSWELTRVWLRITRGQQAHTNCSGMCGHLRDSQWVDTPTPNYRITVCHENYHAESGRLVFFQRETTKQGDRGIHIKLYRRVRGRKKTEKGGGKMRQNQRGGHRRLESVGSVRSAPGLGLFCVYTGDTCPLRCQLLYFLNSERNPIFIF